MVSPVDFEAGRRRAEALARRTSLGVGGRPRYLFEPSTEEECARVVHACRRAGVTLYYLGGGYNLLVTDEDLDGAVLATRRLRYLRVFADRVEVGAGNPFPELVRRSIELGIPGLPGCPGIPGSVGGVVCMNAGGRFGSVGDALVEVRGVDAEGRRFRRGVEAGDLGYRTSVFRDVLVTGATLRRDPALRPEAQRRLFREALAWKKATQPLGARSAGCMFRNPQQALDGRSAGQLIDMAGLKGRRVGGAMVSPLHANFIVNAGDATARDLFDLIRLVRDEVRARYAVDLELEVTTWA